MDSKTEKFTASILVVDDYVVTQRVLSTQLRKGGYEVTTAGSGQEALCFLAQRTFNLAIIDVAMPEMDGVAFLSQLLEIQPNIARLMLSGYADLQSVMAAINKVQIFRFIATFECERLHVERDGSKSIQSLPFANIEPLQKFV